MKRILLVCLSILSALSLAVAQPQPDKLILDRQEGRITFALDEVDPVTSSINRGRSGEEIARDLRGDTDGFLSSDWTPEIIANSFADENDLHSVGEDVVFQMLLKAWCQHRPVVLSPDAIWLVICQQVSYCINKDPEAYRALLVDHEGKKTLEVKTEEDLFSGKADWPKLIAGFTSQIGLYTKGDITTTLVADFTTTGVDERIASEMTLMDVVKPYFNYEIIYAVCGIPSITLTGTPDDWRKVLEKTRALEAFGFGWWTSELEPILEEFILAAEGKPDYWFWKDIVSKTRPRTIQGPSCMRKPKPQTRFDGWFLKFFPFDNKGRSPESVTITQNMLPETVVVPFKYKTINDAGAVLSERPMELVAGIVGVLEDAQTFTLTPKIGWFVRTVKPEEVKSEETYQRDSLLHADILEKEQILDQELTMDSSIKYWDERPLELSDLQKRTSDWPDISRFEYGISLDQKEWKVGNTRFSVPSSRTYMNPFASWLHPGYASPDMLCYFQTMFDYVEICRRRAEADFAGGSSFSRREVMAFHLDVADSFIAKLKEETASGLDTTAVHHYSRLVSNELAQTGEIIDDDLRINPKGWSIGLHVGLGNEFYTGAASEYFHPITGLKFGFDISFGRALFVWDMMLGPAGRLKQDLLRDGYKWNAGERIHGGNMELALGYTVYDSQWWKVSPYAGVGVGFMDYPSNPGNPEKEKDEIDGLRLVAGLAADYKIRRKISSTPIEPTATLSERSVRAKLYVARTNFPIPDPAWSVNFSIGFNFLAWLLKK